MGSAQSKRSLLVSHVQLPRLLVLLLGLIYCKSDLGHQCFRPHTLSLCMFRICDYSTVSSCAQSGPTGLRSLDGALSERHNNTNATD